MHIGRISRSALIAISKSELLTFGWLATLISKKIGKKRTAYLSFFVGSVLLMAISFFKEAIPILVIMFLASIPLSLAWPALRGTFTDYVAESPSYNKEIEILNDSSTNMGYIIGPIVGGMIVDKFGYGNMFSLMALVGMSVTLFLFLITPRNIQVVLHR